jgi:hypothetical protein
MLDSAAQDDKTAVEQAMGSLREELPAAASQELAAMMAAYFRYGSDGRLPTADDVLSGIEEINRGAANAAMHVRYTDELARLVIRAAEPAVNHWRTVNSQAAADLALSIEEGRFNYDMADSIMSDNRIGPDDYSRMAAIADEAADRLSVDGIDGKPLASYLEERVKLAMVDAGSLPELDKIYAALPEALRNAVSATYDMNVSRLIVNGLENIRREYVITGSLEAGQVAMAREYMGRLKSIDGEAAEALSGRFASIVEGPEGRRVTEGSVARLTLPSAEPIVAAPPSQIAAMSMVRPLGPQVGAVPTDAEVADLAKVMASQASDAKEALKGRVGDAIRSAAREEAYALGGVVGSSLKELTVEIEGMEPVVLSKAAGTLAEGQTLLDALKKMSKEAPDNAALAKAVADAAAKGYMQYETAYAVYEDGTSDISKEAAIKIDKDGKVVAQTSTETVDLRKAVVVRGHNHPGSYDAATFERETSVDRANLDSGVFGSSRGLTIIKRLPGGLYEARFISRTVAIGDYDAAMERLFGKSWTVDRSLGEAADGTIVERLDGEASLAALALRSLKEGTVAAIARMDSGAVEKLKAEIDGWLPGAMASSRGRDAPDLKTVNGLAVILKMAGVFTEEHGVVVDTRRGAFDYASVVGAISGIDVRNSPVKYYVVVEPDQDLGDTEKIKGINIVRAPSGASVALSVRQYIDTTGVKMPDYNIAYAVTDSLMSVANIDQHYKENAAKGAKALSNFLVANKGAIEKDSSVPAATLIVELTAKLASQNRPTVFAVGCQQTTIARLKGMLNGILRLIQKLNLNAIMSEFVSTMRAVSVSA